MLVYRIDSVSGTIFVLVWRGLRAGMGRLASHLPASSLDQWQSSGDVSSCWQRRRSRISSVLCCSPIEWVHAEVTANVLLRLLLSKSKCSCRWLFGPLRARHQHGWPPPAEKSTPGAAEWKYSLTIRDRLNWTPWQRCEGGFFLFP